MKTMRLDDVIALARKSGLAAIKDVARKHTRGSLLSDAAQTSFWEKVYEHAFASPAGEKKRDAIERRALWDTFDDEARSAAWAWLETYPRRNPNSGIGGVLQARWKAPTRTTFGHYALVVSVNGVTHRVTVSPQGTITSAPPRSKSTARAIVRAVNAWRPRKR